ncbi:outer membrane usher protein fimD precursor [Vibrio astriarenae]|nr:outer membrane usher protein fimD precursor [Vibrio sp. C7]
MNVGYSKTKDSEAINYGVAGSIVAFDKGVVMSQPIGSTFAIVDTSGIEGVRVRSKPGVVTDQNGYALVDYVTPYEFTNVSIDTTHSKGLSSDTESVRVSPIEGAGVKASFDTRRGVDLLISSTNEGSKIPFGTSITVNDKPDVNVFGDDGQVYISSAPVKGIIKAYINGTSKKPCVFEYQIEEAESQFQFITTKCVFE